MKTTTSTSTKGPALEWVPVEDIKREYGPGPGRHWFDRETMRFFRSYLPSFGIRGPGGTCFVTSEQGPRMPRQWTVRRLAGPGRIETVGEFCGYETRVAANRAAIKAAKGEVAP